MKVDDEGPGEGDEIEERQAKMKTGDGEEGSR